MTFTPVSWALVGLGAGGRVFHAPLLRAAEGVELAVAGAVTITTPVGSRESARSERRVTVAAV